MVTPNVSKVYDKKTETGETGNAGKTSIGGIIQENLLWPMDQLELTNLVNSIGDFVQEGNNLRSKRTKAVISYLEHLRLNSTKVSEKITKTPQTNQNFIGEKLWKDKICWPKNKSSPNEVNNNIDARLNSSIDTQENKLLSGENLAIQNDEAKAEKDKKQMQATSELAEF